MPVLMKRSAGRPAQLRAALDVTEDGSDVSLSDAGLMAISATLLAQCGNTACRSGWMKLWRSRQYPMLEGKWACSPACMREIAKTAILREAGDQKTEKFIHQHRVPLGLLMLSRGMITREQLRRSLEAQKNARQGRLGEWLIRHGAADEAQVTRALSAQWNCPVLAATPHDPALMAAACPRLLMESFGGVPLRMAGSTILYMAFERRIDHCLVLGVERMLGLKVEAGIVVESEYRRLREDAMRAAFPKTKLLEAANLRGLIHACTAMIEESKAVRSRIVRVQDSFWLRIWRRPADERGGLPSTEDVEDMVCSLSAWE